MPAKLPVPVGERFGHLTVVEPAPNIGRYTAWLCRCDCGRQKTVVRASVVKGRTRSCGCQQHAPKHGYARAGEISPLYWTWTNLRARCSNRHNPEWSNYGGRGVTVCDRWEESFANFLADMGERPDWATGGIDRIDNDGGYWCGHCEECQREGHPSNCRWSTVEQQNKNKRKAAE